MCKLKYVLFFTICAFYAVDKTFANSLIDPYVCGQPSCKPSSKFNYQTTVIYQYDYNTTINTWFAGASENQTTLDVGAKISIEFFSQCEGLLKILSADFKDLNEEYSEERIKTFNDELSAFSLRFAFHDGIVTELCAQEEEQEWTLNFKRGILSLFQNSMGRFDIDHRGIERDVHGTCDTEYRMQGQMNTSLIIMKKKDLAQCDNRYKYLSILQTVRYNFQSKYQTWPVLQSESRCRIEIDHNVYTGVECKERHIFEPFSGKKSGAMTTVVQNLRLSSELNKSNTEIMEEKKEEWESIKRRHNLHYNHAPIVRTGSGELRTSRDFLKQLCKIEKAISDMDSPETPTSDFIVDNQAHTGEIVSIWGGFVRACRSLNYPSLFNLLNRSVHICPQAKKHVIDALPYIASVGSVELINEMIIKKTVTEETTKEWLMSVSMIPRPQKEMIVSMKELLQHFPGDKFVSLAVSSMVHSYCRNSQKTLSDCCLESQNADIIRALQDNIEIDNLLQGNVGRNLREKASISIKSLGNIGCFANTTQINFADRLMEIIENPVVPLQVRLHIIDAFRKTPCSETREYFLELFRKQSLDVEIRIASYLQVMRCPKYVTIKAIIRILEDERINQVESFVWSHLQNLAKSTIPSRVEKQGLLSGNTIPTPKQQPDFRKFSRNYENGIFFDQYNAGGNYEANLIMSPESYIPRSASLNLTIDMFGESINILELNLRNEGFEKYIEDIFTNSGPLSRSKVEDKVKMLRFRRSSNEANTINKLVDDIPYENDATIHRKPMLDMGMKVFGNEISYWNAEGNDEIMDGISKLNPLYHIKNVLSGKEISYKKSSLFLDTSYSVPTGCGLPLIMNLMGTSVVNLKMSGSISGTDKFYETRTLHFEGKMRPSMALNVAATMNVLLGGLGSTGIRLNTRLHTSTALATDLNIQSGKVISFKVSMPHTKQEIFQASSELLLLQGSREIKPDSINKNTVAASTCSWKALDYAVGIKMCATYEFPNVTDMADAPYFLMAGPAKYLLSLEKVDPTAKVYSFLLSWHANDTAKLFGFSFNTPGSKTQRTFNSSISLYSDSGTAAVAFQSHNMYLKAHAKYRNQPNNKLIECVLDVDGQKHFDAVMSLTKQEQKNGYIMIPRVYLAVNNEKITELIGTLKMAQKKGVSQCDVSVDFQTKKLASRLIGYITWNGPSKGANLKLNYKFLEEKKQSIKLEALISNREIGQRKDFYGELGLEFTSYPHLNFFSNAKYLGTTNHIECNMNVSTSRETVNNPMIHYSLGSHRTIEGYRVNHHLKLLRPYLDMYYKYEESGALKTINTTLVYDKVSNPNSVVAVTGKLYFPEGMRLYMDAALNITLPSLTPMVCDIRLHEQSTNDFRISIQGIWFTGTDVSVVALYQDQSSPHLASRKLKAIISGSSFKEISMQIYFSQNNKQISINVRAEQEQDLYGVTGRYITYSEKNFSCYGQVDVKSKSYSVSVLADLFNDTNIVADIHIDQIRDIRVIYTKINRPKMKRINGDINWDSNRDPNQKISFAAEFLNKETLNYGGSFMLFYPGRVINGDFDFILKDWLCQWHVKTGWSPDDIILWKVKLLSQFEKETMYALLSEMDTPFEGWRDTSLNLVWRYVDNLQSLSGNMTWEKERLVFGLQGDYMLKTNEVFGEIVALVNSTLPSLPKVSAIARHHHLWRKNSDTLLSFEYSEGGLMMLNSSWRIDKDAMSYNISGRVGLKSPFEGYKSGLMVTKFMFNQKRDVTGLTHLDIEDKIYLINIDGHIHRITNSMFVFNVTSPTPSSTLLSGRLGFVDSDRHAVAMIETPNITVGAEALVRLQSFKDFHIYGHIAIPIDSLKDTMITAKIGKEEIDLRIGYMKHKAGFMGIWHYNHIVDFQYLYKVFTPISGFEENGLVLKNLYNGDDLDTEASIRLSKLKLGIAFFAKDNEKGLLQLIERRFKGIQSTDIDNIFEDFSSNIYAVIDTLVYPTITFDAQLNKYNNLENFEVVKIAAQLQLPNMTAITLKNKMIFEDMATFTQDLHIMTPFKNVEEIKFYQAVEIILEEKYNLTYSLHLKNETDWSNNSLVLFYQHEIGEDDIYTTRTANIALITQLDVLKHLKADMQIHVDASLTRIHANIDTPSCQLSAGGKVEMDEIYVDITGEMNLTSPYIQPYEVKLDFKKDFSDVENVVVFGLKVKQGTKKNFLYCETSWRTAITDQLRAKIGIALVPVIQPTEVVLALSQTETHSVVKGEAKIGSRENVFTIVAELKADFATIIVATPYKGFKNMNLTGELKNNKTIIGTFQNDAKVYNINGEITSRNPLELAATIRPVDGGETYQMKIKMTDVTDKFNLQITLIGALQFNIFTNLVKGKGYREFSTRIDSSNAYIKEIFIKSRTELTDDKRVLFNVQARTPFNNLKTLQADADLSLTPRIGAMICQYNMTNLIGENDIRWSFIPDDIYFKIMSYQTTNEETRSLDINSFHFNNITSGKSVHDTTSMGFHIDLDNAWKCGSNVSIQSIHDKMLDLSVNVLLPLPNVDVHTIHVAYENEDTEAKSAYLIYTTDISKKLASASGRMETPTDNILANLTLKCCQSENVSTIDNIMKFFMLGNLVKLDYRLISPYYIDEDTLKVKGTYSKESDSTLLIGNICYPESSSLFDIDLNYGGINHTTCHVNTTTPFKKVPWLKTKAFISNSELTSENLIQVFWTNHSALLNSTHVVNKDEPDTTAHRGVLVLEVPVNTIHTFKSEYTFNEGKNWNKGTNILYYNNNDLMNGQFKTVTDTGERDLQRDTMDASVDIKNFSPFGVHYVHQYNEDSITDIKQVSVYELHNATNFNLTGRLDIEPWKSGKQVKIMAIQGEKTIKFENNYESVDNAFFQGSKLEWTPDIWLDYEIDILNKTTSDDESQEVKVTIKYPKRSFSILADYHLKNTLLEGSADMNWNLDDENKTVKIEGMWLNPDNQDSTLHDVKLSLIHPSFSKDVTFLGKYMSDISTTSDVTMSLDYSEDPEDKLTFHSILSDNSNGPIRDYKFDLDCQHPSTNLALVIKSNMTMKYRLYHAKNFYSYQKSKFDQNIKFGEYFIDWQNKTVQYKHLKDKEWYNLDASVLNIHPEHKVFVHVNRTTGVDDGIWVLSTKNKSIVAHFNRTDDVSYHLVGLIKDARTAVLNAWRDFDNITTVDISSYLRLNHSRLLTSQILWRPEIPQEAKTRVSTTFKEVYSQITDFLSIWKGIPVETLDVMKNVWSEVKPKIKEFLNDLNDLHVIKEDLDNFHSFLKESYDSNEFYSKDITEFTLNIIDQLALRNQIESIPNIVKELWQVMGDTGKSFREGLTWITDEIKSSHSKLMDKINSILDADIMEQVSSILESGIHKYDAIMKSLHTQFTHYLETTWKSITIQLHIFWRGILKSLEPTYLRIAHYAETFVWKFGREVMNFFNEKTNEITESPYFNMFSSLTQNVDDFIKDLNNNDAITNIKKYTKMTLKFVNDKILVHVPFRKELQNIVTEIANELNKLQDLKLVQLIKAKIAEAKGRLEWWYDYFKIANVFDGISYTVYKKFVDGHKTALQNEEENRTPKTNFIFDPRKGQLLLEQKLPVPWHAFNRTPDISQIPEYQRLHELMDSLILSNRSIMSYYYELMPYTDLYNLLPPFYGYAIITATGTIVTLDKEVFNVASAGTFLLARDFLQKNFTILLESQTSKKYNIVLLTSQSVIRVDLFKEKISKDGSEMISLPTRIDEYIIERDEVSMKITHDHGLQMDCDFHFKTCLFKFDGWYYARLGGLFGTMNNEPYDDMYSSSKQEPSTVLELAQSWKVMDSVNTLINDEPDSISANSTECEAYFKNKVSPFKPCFTFISPLPYYAECIRGTDPCVIANVYMKICMSQFVPIRTPEKCMECVAPDGRLVDEGSFNFAIEVPDSTDVVFIIETHACNYNIRKNKSIDQFINILDGKLKESGLKNNRYAVVGYGKSGKHSSAYYVYYKNKLFNTELEIADVFDQMEFESEEFSSSENYSSDAFHALSVASSITFRPGVSKTFILFPCTKCIDFALHLDYSVVHQVLTDSSVTLHIIMNGDFNMDKKRVAKTLFGIDGELAYTVKDTRQLMGDAELRRQVKLPKAQLGFCVSLAIETNGTIFSGNKMRYTEPQNGRRAATVLSTRISKTSRPCPTARCECHASVLKCTACPRHIGRSHLNDISMHSWDSEEMDDFIDNFLDMSVPIIT